MFASEPQSSGTIGHRAISATIGAVCGFGLGYLLSRLSMALFGDGFGLVWFFAIGAAIFGFVAPGHSREIWSAVWSAILGFFYKLLDTRRFYR